MKHKYGNDKMLQRWRVHMLVATPVNVNLKTNQSNFLMFSTVRYNGLLLHQSRTKIRLPFPIAFYPWRVAKLCQ